MLSLDKKKYAHPYSATLNQHLYLNFEVKYDRLFQDLTIDKIKK